jgi:DNA-binding MarR family transcriptional regulator
MDRKPTESTTAIWVLLNIAHKRVTHTFEAELKRAGLPPAAWYDVLWALECHPEGLRQNQLEGMSLFDQANLSRTIKRMVEDGLVTQVPAPEDRRGRILTITDAGHALRLAMWQVYGPLMISEIERKVPEGLAQGLVDGLQSLVPEFEKIAP